MSELRRLGEIISPTLSKLETSDGARAYGLWARAAGDPIAANARPRRFARGLLTVECSSSIWANELTYLAPQLLTRMAELEPGGPVQRLRFVTSRVPFGPPRDGGGPAAEERRMTGSGPEAAATGTAASGPEAAAKGRERAQSPASARQVDRPSPAKTEGRERHRRNADPAAARTAAEAVGDERLRAAILAALDRRSDAPEAAHGDGPAVNQK